MILSPFSGSRLTGADDPGSPFAFSVCDHEQAPCCRETNAEKPEFALRVVWIRNRELEPVAEDGHCFGKSDAVLCDVRCVLLSIPFEFHQSSLHCVAPVRYSSLALFASNSSWTVNGRGSRANIRWPQLNCWFSPSPARMSNGVPRSSSWTIRLVLAAGPGLRSG